MSEEELKAIEERAAKATPGPWHWRGNVTGKSIWLGTGNGMGLTVMDFVRWGFNGVIPRFREFESVIMHKAKTVHPEPHNHWMISDIDHPDAQFIAHSRQDVDSLLAEVRRLRKLVDGE